MIGQMDDAVRRAAIGATTMLLLSTSASADDHRRLGPDFFECGPVTGTCAPDECAGPVNITVMRDGGVKWNGSRVDKKTLVGWLGDAAKLKPQSVFWIHPEADTSYAAAARTILLFHQARIRRLYCVVPDQQ